MLSSLNRLRVLVLGTGTLVLLQTAASAQVSFYGAPYAPGFRSTAPSFHGTGPSHRSTGDEATDDGEDGGNDEGLAPGLGIFSRKPFVMTFAVREGYDSNTFTTSTDPTSSFYTNFGAGINYSFGSPRLQLGANLGGGVTYYYTRPGDKVDFNGSIGVNALYRASPRLNLSLVTSTAYLSQPDVAIVGGPTRQEGDYLYSSTTLSAAYQWTETISTITSYNFTALYYLENELNNNQGNISQTLAQSINWLWKPRTTLVAEYRVNPITYYQADLNQLGNYFLVGFDHIFNPRFFWNLRGGVQVNLNNNPVDGQSTYVGPFMESTLRYQLREATALSWNMRYGTEQSGISNVTQRQTFRTGLTLTHAFTARISGNLGVNYLCNYYQQNGVIDDFYENIIDVGLGVQFKINRFTSLEAGYSYIVDIAPEFTGRNYTRNIAFVGANFSF